LVEIPPVPFRDPADAVLGDAAVVPEGRRFCAHCGEPVGRGRDGAPGRTSGFCTRCGAPFTFEPHLRTGELVSGQYEVVGCLAHGGMGWIYLARDRNVSDRWVVLKGVLNADDHDAMAAALAERRFLAEVEHPNIVKIFNFVEHASSGYIVMEYVGGRSLKQILDMRAADGGDPSALAPAQAIAYMLEILPALGYLHQIGLLFCDFKIDNIIQTRHSLKLIDLGSVYRLDGPSSAVFGTVGYEAPEIRAGGPSIASDLFTVARTLAVLCFDFRGYRSTYRFTLPPQESVPLLARYDSLYQFLLTGPLPIPAIGSSRPRRWPTSSTECSARSWPSRKDALSPHPATCSAARSAANAINRTGTRCHARQSTPTTPQPDTWPRSAPASPDN
jgi:serine/threonine-protein kinase PknG